MVNWITLFLLIVIFSSQASAFDRKGFSPVSPFSVFSTFSAETPKQNQVAAEIGYDMTIDPDMKRLTFNISYGLRDNFEVMVNLPYVFNYYNSFKANGFEDISIGVKHRLINESDYTPAIAYLIFGAGDFGEEAFSTEGGWGAGFIVSKKVGPIKAHGNLIYFRPNSNSLNDSWNLNLGSELAVSYNSKILLELIGRKAVYKNKIDLIEWKLGYRIRITDFSYTTVGVGFDIKDRNPDLRFIFGISVILPPEKTQIRKIVD